MILDSSIVLFSVLIWIIVLSKIIAHWIKVVDVLMYIILWFFISWFLDPHSKEIIKFLSEIWVLFLMFYAWWHEDSRTFISKIIENKWIAIIWAIWPFIWAYLSMYLLGFSFNEWIVAWFIFSATAVPFTVAILHSLKLDKTLAAKSILAAAMTDDFISIITMSAVFSTFISFQSWKDINVLKVFLSTWKWILYLILCLLIFIILSKYIFPYHSNNYKNHKWIKKVFLFIRQIFWLKWFTMKFHKVEILVPTIIFLMLFLSLFAELMWVHPAIGAYLTWLILNNDMFHQDENNNKNNIDLNWLMYSLANHFIWPIFFIYLWTKLLIDLNSINSILFISLILFLFVTIFQFLSASIAARYTANLDLKNSILVWLWMLPRDVLAFVTLWIAVENWLINNSSFSTIIILAIIFLNIFTPIAIDFYTKNYYNKD